MSYSRVATIDDLLEALAPNSYVKSQLSQAVDHHDREIQQLILWDYRADGQQMMFSVDFPESTPEDAKRQAKLYLSYLDAFFSKREKAADELLMESIPGDTPQNQ